MQYIKVENDTNDGTHLKALNLNGRCRHGRGHAMRGRWDTVDTIPGCHFGGFIVAIGIAVFASADCIEARAAASHCVR